MFEKMLVENSELRPIIYEPYKMALMRNASKEIDVEIINGTVKPPLGPIGAAIANAGYRIIGVRLRDKPLIFIGISRSPLKIKWHRFFLIHKRI